MSWISIWHWALAAIFIVPLAYLAVGLVILVKEKTGDSNASGFGGWMIGIVILQLFVLVLLALGIRDLFAHFESVEGTAHGALSTGGQIAIKAIALIVVLVAIVAMFRRSRRFPTLYAVQWGLLLLLPALEFLWEAWALDLTYDQLVRLYDFGVLIGAILVLVIGGGSTWYLYASWRAKNTFVR